MSQLPGRGQDENGLELEDTTREFIAWLIHFT